MAVSILFGPMDNVPLSELKNINLKKHLVKTLVVSGEDTIPNLSKETGYSIPTITKAVGELKDEGILMDCGKIDSVGGRRPTVYGINPVAFYFLGVEVKRNAISIGLQSANRKMMQFTQNIPYNLENNASALNRLCEIINEFIEQSKVGRKKIVGACVNMTGRINSREGISYSYFYSEEKALAAAIEAKIEVKTHIENDSRAMTFGEYSCGVVNDEQNVLFINISWGLGMGIVCNGRLYYGKSGYSGEFGHASVFDNDIICHCGKKGCLETEVSGWALDRKVKAKLKAGASSVLTRGKPIDDAAIDELTVEDIINAVTEHEDVLVIEVIEEMGTKLGRYLAMLVNIFNPDLVIIGGMLAAVSDYMQLPVQTALKRYSLNLVNQDVIIKISKLGETAGVIGACHICRNIFLGL